MVQTNHIEILKKGPEAWNRWRKDNPQERPKPRRANLFKATLNIARLGRALFSDGDLEGANLKGADFTGADITPAGRRKKEKRSR